MVGTYLDETLHYLGKYGRYQVMCALVIMTIGNWFPAWHLMGIIFTADSPNNYHCTTWESTDEAALGPDASYTSLGTDVRTDAPYVFLSVDGGNSSSGNVSKKGDQECRVDATGETCTEWQYVTQYGETTIVTDLNLVCTRGFLTETAQSIFFVGTLLGPLLFGYLSDAFGRKKVLLLACLAHGICGTVITFVWNYIVFVMLWFLVGMFSQGYNQVQFVIVMEMFPPECRTLMGSLNNMFWGLGVITLTPIAYLLKNWRHMQLAISVPCLVAIPLWFVLDDSVRWLIAQGRFGEAVKILNKMARWNRVTPPTGGFVLTREDEQGVLDNYKENKTSQAGSSHIEQVEKKSCTYLDVLKSRRMLLTTIIIYFCWFVSMMTYYGVSLNSANLAGNKYANFFFLGLAELPSFFIIQFTMTWWGRRPSIGLFFLLSGLATVTTAFIPKQTPAGADLTVAIIVMAILAKLCITCAFAINLIICPEIFPTPVRNIAFGIGAVVANMGTVISPFVLYLDGFASFLPLTIFGGLCIAAAVLVPILPETKDKPLPETIDDAKRLRGRTRPKSWERLQNRNKEGKGKTACAAEDQEDPV